MSGKTRCFSGSGSRKAYRVGINQKRFEMSYADINETLLPEDKTAIKTGIDAVKAKLPFMVNLTPEERHKLRKLGANRMSYASDANLAANSNQKALPASLDLNAYNGKVKLMDDLKEVYAWLTPLYEGVESTLMAVGAEVMKLTDDVYGHLKVEAKKSKDQNLNAIVKNIADQLKQHKKNNKQANS